MTKFSLLHYPPYGSALPGLQYNYADDGDTSRYRFGFNTQEKDDEIAGEGNVSSAEYWEYDARLGRRWNVDPANRSFISNYSTFSNNPILRVDKYGALDDIYVDESGNLLGSDGDEKSNEIRVISKENWNKVVGSKKSDEITDEDRNKLKQDIQKLGPNINGPPKPPTSKLLNKYEKGIHIGDGTWSKIKTLGGKRLFPYVENLTSSTVYYKPESKELNPYVSNNTSNSIAPNSELYSPVDGIATSQYSNSVYKVTTGGHLRVWSYTVLVMDYDEKSQRLGPLMIDGWIVKNSYWYSLAGLDHVDWAQLYSDALKIGKNKR